MQPHGQVGQADHLGAKARREGFATLQRPVGDGHGSRLASSKVGGHQFDHLACADEQHVDVAQVFKKLAGQAHGRRRHADRMGANFGGSAHFLGHRKTALEHLVERDAEGAGLVGGAHGVFHLAQDLRLAKHHGVQSAGHPEGVARRLVT